MQQTTTALWQNSSKELVAAIAARETRRRQEDAEMLRELSALDNRGVATELGYSNTVALLMHVLRITRKDARQRLTRAAELFEQTTPTGAVIEPSLPHTAEALVRGDISTDHVDVISSTLNGLDDLEPEKRALAEQYMLKQAADDDPRALARFGGRVRDMVDPDGPPPPPDPDPQPTQWVRRHIRRDGSTELTALLDVESSQRLDALMKLLDKPHPEANDTRSSSERAGDAFADVLRMAANCPDLPTHNGLKTEMAVIVSIETLQTKLNDAVLPGQTTLTAGDARRLACDAHLLPAVMDGNSQPLDVASPAYVVPAHIRRALVLRDRGCAFPSCDRPASACDSHHILEWLQNGLTYIDNLVLLCGHHHRLIHRSEWTVRLINGWAYFTPPKYVDPSQQPRYNTLHRPQLPIAA